MPDKVVRPADSRTTSPYELWIFGHHVASRPTIVFSAPAVAQLALALVQVPWLVIVETCRLMKHDKKDPGKTSFIKVANRIWKEHGLWGFYRGTMPALCGAIASGTLLLATSQLAGWPRGSPLAYSLKTQLGILAVSTFTVLPFEIMTMRAILCPEKLSLWTPVKNLQRLLTPAERDSPFKHLYTRRKILAYLVPAIPPILLESCILPILGRFCQSRGAMLFASAVLYSLVWAVLGTPLGVNSSRILASVEDTSRGDRNKHSETDSSVDLEDVPYHQSIFEIGDLFKEGGFPLIYSGWPLQIFQGQISWREALGLPIMSQMYGGNMF